jgi:hypothetical protein
VLVDENTCLTWPRFGVFFSGTVAVALLAGSLGDAVGVPFAMVLSLAGAATVFHFGFRR